MRPRERLAKCPSADPEDPRPAICGSSPRRTNPSTIPKNCHACRKGQSLFLSKATNRGRPSVAVMPRQERIRNPLCPSSFCRTCQTLVDGFPRQFPSARSASAALAKPMSSSGIVPAVVPAARPGASVISHSALGGQAVFLTLFPTQPITECHGIVPRDVPYRVVWLYLPARRPSDETPLDSISSPFLPYPVIAFPSRSASI